MLRCILRPCICGAKGTPGHLYLIKEREFIKTKELIYKIGKTTNIKHRMPAYPKDSRLFVALYCDTDIHRVEKALIATFDAKFTKRSDIGREYYETTSEVDILYEFVNTVFKEF